MVFYFVLTADDQPISSDSGREIREAILEQVKKEIEDRGLLLRNVIPFDDERLDPGKKSIYFAIYDLPLKRHLYKEAFEAVADKKYIPLKCVEPEPGSVKFHGMGNVVEMPSRG